jgi:uncharacterized membrane protein YkvA (DUF1232 family)
LKKRLANLVRLFRDEVGVYRSVMADPRCPRLARWLLAGTIAYALSPVDLIPDFIPVIGYLDDLLIIPILLWLALRLIPAGLVAEHRATRRRQAEHVPVMPPDANEKA